jgi:hypothetical protein
MLFWCYGVMVLWYCGVVVLPKEKWIISSYIHRMNSGVWYSGAVVFWFCGFVVWDENNFYKK